MWVVLVVGILNKEWDRGQIHLLRRKLQEIPGDLYELFRDIITRDTHNKDNLVLCIQWVLFAKEPMSPEQLYHAILSGVDLEAVCLWDAEEITEDVLRRFILDCSKGLAEVTVSEEKRVQFIHESVRDFLLQEDGLGKIWPELKSNFRGQSQERLKQCCSNYCSLVMTQFWYKSHRLAKVPSKQEVHERELAIQQYPLLEYAVSNLPFHADVAEGCGVSQSRFLEDFPSQHWITLSNLIEEDEASKRSEDVSCTYLLAELDKPNLLEACLTSEQCMAIGKGRYGCPLFAAAATSSDQALEVCLRHLIRGRPSKRPLYPRVESKSEQELDRRETLRSFIYLERNGLLLSAAELGIDVALAFLVDLGKPQIDAMDTMDRTVLWWASKNGCQDAVLSLLRAGSIMVNHKDKDDQTPLFIAARSGNHMIAKMLLDHGADPNIPNGRHGNVLQVASERGDVEVVKLLLGAGANVNCKDDHEVTPLRSASCCGYEAIVKILLDASADVNVERGTNLPPLLGASLHGYVTIVEMLLEAGADVTVQNRIGLTALSCASLECVDFAMPTARDQHVHDVADHRKWLASVHERKWGTSGVQDIGKMPRQEAIVKLLLDNGADPNAQVRQHGNELCLAASNGDDAVVKMLLDAGADVNAQCEDHGNALNAALAYNHKVVARMLVENGAKSSSIRGNKRMATSA